MGPAETVLPRRFHNHVKKRMKGMGRTRRGRAVSPAPDIKRADLLPGSFAHPLLKVEKSAARFQARIFKPGGEACNKRGQDNRPSQEVLKRHRQPGGCSGPKLSSSTPARRAMQMAREGLRPLPARAATRRSDSAARSECDRSRVRSRAFRSAGTDAPSDTRGCRRDRAASGSQA